MYRNIRIKLILKSKEVNQYEYTFSLNSCNFNFKHTFFFIIGIYREKRSNYNMGMDFNIDDFARSWIYDLCYVWSKFK